MRDNDNKNKTTSINPARQASRQMFFGMLIFGLLLVILKLFS